MQSVEQNRQEGTVDWKKVARAMRRPVPVCASAHKRFSEQQALGATRTVMENGVRVTYCPPAWAGGVSPQNYVRASKNNN